jgi:hypothetical protein
LVVGENAIAGQQNDNANGNRGQIFRTWREKEGECRGETESYEEEREVEMLGALKSPLAGTVFGSGEMPRLDRRGSAD